MKYTLNYRLKKPDQTDYYNVQDFDENFDAIDEAIKGVEENSDKEDNNLLQKIHKRTIMATGSYVGNGKKEFTLNFQFTPKHVRILGTAGTHDYSQHEAVWTEGMNRIGNLISVGPTYAQAISLNVTRSANRLTFKDSGAYQDNFEQMNVSGSTYYYVAFGEADD